MEEGPAHIRTSRKGQEWQLLFLELRHPWIDCTLKGQHVTANRLGSNWVISGHLNMFQLLVKSCKVRLLSSEKHWLFTYLIKQNNYRFQVREEGGSKNIIYYFRENMEKVRVNYGDQVVGNENAPTEQKHYVAVTGKKVNNVFLNPCPGLILNQQITARLLYNSIYPHKPNLHVPASPQWMYLHLLNERTETASRKNTVSKCQMKIHRFPFPHL